MLKGFKDFITRGNVIDLAVGVAIASAFTTLIKAFSDNVINPLLAAMGGANVSGLSYQLVDGNPKSTIDFAALITALITFLLTAAIIYFVLVMPMNKFNEMRRVRAGLPAKEDDAPDEQTLLTEIRDLLRSRA